MKTEMGTIWVNIEGYFGHVELLWVAIWVNKIGYFSPTIDSMYVLSVKARLITLSDRVFSECRCSTYESLDIKRKGKEVSVVVEFLHFT